MTPLRIHSACATGAPGFPAVQTIRRLELACGKDISVRNELERLASALDTSQHMIHPAEVLHPRNESKVSRILAAAAKLGTDLTLQSGEKFLAE